MLLVLYSSLQSFCWVYSLLFLSRILQVCQSPAFIMTFTCSCALLEVCKLLHQCESESFMVQSEVYNFCAILRSTSACCYPEVYKLAAPVQTFIISCPYFKVYKLCFEVESFLVLSKCLETPHQSCSCRFPVSDIMSTVSLFLDLLMTTT